MSKLSARLIPEIDVRPEVFHHLVKLHEIQRLRAIADRLLGRWMDLHQQTICADRDGRPRKCRHEAPFTGSMAWIDHDRKMREFAERRHRGNVARVARDRFEGAYTALAQDYVWIPVRDDILGRHQQLFDSGTHAALE